MRARVRSPGSRGRVRIERLAGGGAPLIRPSATFSRVGEKGHRAATFSRVGEKGQGCVTSPVPGEVAAQRRVRARAAG